MTSAPSPAAPPLHIVLHEPLIPPNTGSVGRLCVGTGCRLHLVGPLGFSLSEKAVRRAGLDYWRDVDLVVHDDLAGCLAAIGAPASRVHYLSARGATVYTEVAYAQGDVLVFGKETTGLPDAILAAVPGQTLRLPRFGPVRSFNLATVVGIVAFEALRQLRPDAFPPPPCPSVG